MLLGLILALAPAPQNTTRDESGVALPPAGIDRPVFSSNGKLAFATAGDVWVVEAKGGGALRGPEDIADGVTWRRITRHPGDDRDPAWTSDGRAIVFASNRSGSFDLYRVAIGRGDTGEPVRLTAARQADTQPSVSPNGAIVFVRGRRMFLRAVDGQVRALGDAAIGVRHPVFAPHGKSVAYVAQRARSVELRIHRIDKEVRPGDSSKRRGPRPQALDRLVLDDRRVEYPAWSPDGRLLVFSSRGRRPGVWLTDPKGSFTNLVSPVRAAAAFTPDGLHIALAGLPRGGPGYNGDPDRLGERRYPAKRTADRSLTFVRVPAPDRRRGRLPLARPTADTAADRLAAFDRVYDRLVKLYGNGREREWRALWTRLRRRARVAANLDEVEEVIFRLLRERPTLRRKARGRAAVSSAHPRATAAGVEILEKGGNVVEAAIAVSFAIGVVEPDASGVGGYGEMMVYLVGMDEPVCIEFMTRVPGAVTSTPPANGPQRVNVPGVVAGMELAFRRHKSGAVTWSDLLQPAIRLARDGFVIDHAFATTLQRNAARFRESAASRALFFPGGEALRAGDTLENPDLAWTLEQIAKDGADAFYEGEVVKRMLADLRSHGSVMSKVDLAAYFAVAREPVRGTYRGHTIYSAAPPVTGGAALVGKLTVLEHAAMKGEYVSDAATLHEMIEAWKLAPRTSGRIADPSVWPVDVSPFSDKRATEKLWKKAFDPKKSLSSRDISRLRREGVGAAGPARREREGELMTGTTAFAVADGDGNLVAVTQTLGTWGGNFHVSPGLGFLYNDKLRARGSNPSRFGATVPMGRVGTVIAPTLLFRGTGADRKPLVAFGGAGNAWITSAVYQMAVGFIEKDLGPQQALELPRFLVRGSSIQVEDGFAPGVLADLESRGHTVQRISLRGELRMGYAAAVKVLGGHAVAGADPRRAGTAGAVRSQAPFQFGARLRFSSEPYGLGQKHRKKNESKSARGDLDPVRVESDFL